jgi:hypothetical protein
MTEFIPRESDKDWMKGLFGSIKVGGTWVTSWGIYNKVDENTLAVVDFPCELRQLAEVEENINRVKIVCESIGVKFEDKRSMPCSGK